MKIVISCAGSKVKHAGRIRTADGKPVEFVACPDKVVNREPGVIYARPDDVSIDGSTWRQKLLDHNGSLSKSEPSDLLPAYQLYKPRVYQRLVDVFGLENVYILSAGWGLVSASFRLPKYDITFNSSADRSKRRDKRADYDDFNQLNLDSREDLLFFSGMCYVHLFGELTAYYEGRRIVYFKSKKTRCDGADLVYFYTKRSTNWQYECADRVAERFESGSNEFRSISGCILGLTTSFRTDAYLR